MEQFSMKLSTDTRHFSPEPQSLTQCYQKGLHSAAGITLNITVEAMQEE
jgi:hypothetical protein